jgi:hypothetical protein
VLLAGGGNPLLADDKGRTPARMACKWEFSVDKSKEVIQSLLGVRNLERSPHVIASLGLRTLCGTTDGEPASAQAADVR